MQAPTDKQKLILESIMIKISQSYVQISDFLKFKYKVPHKKYKTLLTNLQIPIHCVLNNYNL